MRRKGFTLVELLVVIAIIALLMGILMPALAQVRRLAQRIICGTNLSAIGKGCVTYANTYDDDFPRAGGRSSEWSDNGLITDWDVESSAGVNVEWDAFGTPPGAEATITSCFFLLIKYTDGTPKMFVCRGDVGASVFKLSESTSGDTPDEIIDCHDFGDPADETKNPGEYVSYAYQHPFKHTNAPGSSTTTSLGLSIIWAGGSPLAADRNPYLDEYAKEYVDGSATGEEEPSWTADGQFYDPDKTRNSAAHQRDGQNVLYTDAHVAFEDAPNVGIENDNIWMYWDDTADNMDQEARQFWKPICTGDLNKDKIGPDVGSVHQEDAFLVNEYNGDN